MSNYYEKLGDYLVSDTANQGPCLTEADLAKEERDYESAFDETFGKDSDIYGPDFEKALEEMRSSEQGADLNAIEIGVADSVSNEVAVAKWLVSLHYGHGGLAAGGRKRVEA